MKKFMFIMIAAVAMACASCHTEGTTSNNSNVDSLNNDSTMVEEVVVDSISVDSTLIAK
jgi:hypothetical protein